MERFITKGLLCTLLLMLCAGPALADKIEKIKSRGYMIAGITAKTPPFSFIHNGQAQGFEVDITSHLARKLGVDIKYKTPEETNVLSMLHQGTVDLVAAQVRHTFEHEESVDFSETYFIGGQKLLVQASSPLEKPEDLAEQKIGFVSNENVQSTLKNRLPGCPIQNYATLEAACKDLAEDKIAALAVEVVPFLVKTHQTKPLKDMRFLGKPLMEMPIGIALTENESNFRDLINQTLTEMWLSRDYQKIYGKWFGPHSPFPYPLTWKIETYPY